MTMPHLRMRPLVLVINDDPIFLETIAEILDDEGYDAFCCMIDDQPFPAIVAQQPDVLIIDFPYHRASAWELLAQLDADPRTELIALIATSTDPDNLATFSARESRRPKAAALLKPFELDPLIALIASLIASPV